MNKKSIITAPIIADTYCENYDITYIHDLIKKRLLEEKNTILPEIIKNIDRYTADIQSPQTVIQRNISINTLKRLRAEKQNIESGEKLEIYENRVVHLLAEFKKYVGSVKTVYFGKKEEPQELTDDVRKRLKIIDEYLSIAREYINIDIIRLNPKPTNICLGCDQSLADVVVNNDGILMCPNCKTDQPVASTTKITKDTKINNSSCSDESLDNFYRAFIRFQGLQSDVPPDALYEKLDNYFISKGRPPASEIRKLPPNEHGLTGDTTHKMLWAALAAIGESAHYENANLIGHVLFGWKLQNLMHLKEKLLSHYVITQSSFCSIPKEIRGRNSSLGTAFRLYRHLRLLGVKIDVSQVKLSANHESLRIHNRLWRIMCEEAGKTNPEIYYMD